MNWLIKLWYKRLRKIDLQILWPKCQKYSKNLDEAKAVFAVHAFADKAWLILGEDELYRQIDNLS